MQVKKYEAPTIQEALETIKRELGPEAIILQTKKNKRGFGLMSKSSVEITAAVSERSLHKKKAVEVRMPEQVRESINRAPAAKQAEIIDRYVENRIQKEAARTQDRVSLSSTAQSKSPDVSPGKKITATRYADIVDDSWEDLRKKRAVEIQKQAAQQNPSSNIDTESGKLMKELQDLKKIISDLQRPNDPTSGTGAQALGASPAFTSSAMQEAFDLLVLGGIERRLSYDLIKNAAFELGSERSSDREAVMDQIAAEMVRSTEVMSLLEGLKPQGGSGTATMIALVGPTGVGKTTTLAKVAAEAVVKRGLKVGLINVDMIKPAASDQLLVYAKLLNLPFRNVRTSDELSVALKEMSALDLILLDTAGHSHKDAMSLQHTESMLAEIPGMRTELVLSATTRDQELWDMLQRFSVFKPEGLIFSKLDEAMSFGAIYNISQRGKLPLIYLTTGQKVPEDIEDATPERLTSLIMDL